LNCDWADQGGNCRIRLCSYAHSPNEPQLFWEHLGTHDMSVPRLFTKESWRCATPLARQGIFPAVSG